MPSVAIFNNKIIRDTDIYKYNIPTDGHFFCICREKLIFRRFLGDRRSKFDQKHEKSQHFDLQSAKNHRKIKIFQIATRNLCITLKPSPDIKTVILSRVFPSGGGRGGIPPQ